MLEWSAVGRARADCKGDIFIFNEMSHSGNCTQSLVYIPLAARLETIIQQEHMNSRQANLFENIKIESIRFT